MQRGALAPSEARKSRRSLPGSEATTIPRTPIARARVSASRRSARRPRGCSRSADVDAAGPEVAEGSVASSSTPEAGEPAQGPAQGPARASTRTSPPAAPRPRAADRGLDRHALVAGRDPPPVALPGTSDSSSPSPGAPPEARPFVARGAHRPPTGRGVRVHPGPAGIATRRCAGRRRARGAGRRASRRPRPRPAAGPRAPARTAPRGRSTSGRTAMSSRQSSAVVTPRTPPRRRPASLPAPRAGAPAGRACGGHVTQVDEEPREPPVTSTAARRTRGPRSTASRKVTSARPARRPAGRGASRPPTTRSSGTRRPPAARGVRPGRRRAGRPASARCPAAAQSRRGGPR